MVYALVLPDEILAHTVAIREATGVSIRKQCLDSIWHMIGKCLADEVIKDVKVKEKIKD